MNSTRELIINSEDLNKADALAVKTFKCFKGRKKEDILTTVKTMCYYFRPRNDVEKAHKINDTGLFLKFLKPGIVLSVKCSHATEVNYENNNDNTSGKLFDTKLFIIGEIIQFLNTGSYAMMLSIISQVKSQRDTYTNNEFRTLLRSIVLNYGDFTDPSNKNGLTKILKDNLEYEGTIPTAIQAPEEHIEEPKELSLTDSQ